MLILCCTPKEVVFGGVICRPVKKTFRPFVANVNRVGSSMVEEAEKRVILLLCLGAFETLHALVSSLGTGLPELSLALVSTGNLTDCE